ncbi:MAG: phosphotransacetylase family protein [Deltaproteobacteria bacterium]|nr:phosphotransacetylase family protein [Deltaproteobacteria bacterium]
MAALYVTSLQAGVGKTAVCAGLAKHLDGEGRKVGYFKPMVADIKEKAAVDSDAVFIRKVLRLKETVADLCPVIDRGGDLARKIKQAYEKVAGGKDVVIVEGVWRLRPGAEPVEAACEVVEALGAKVIVVEPYSAELAETDLSVKYRGFGEHLLGVVVNRVPVRRLDILSEQLSSRAGGAAVLGVLPEDRVLFGLTVGEIAERIEGEILNDAGKSAEVVESFMLGAMVVDSGPDYFGRLANKAAVLRSDRPDMQLAALETSTRCLVLSGGVEPTYPVLTSAKDKGIPIILAKGDTGSVVNTLEMALGKPRFNQKKKLPRLLEIMEHHFDFKAVEQGLALE